MNDVCACIKGPLLEETFSSQKGVFGQYEDDMVVRFEDRCEVAAAVFLVS